MSEIKVNKLSPRSGTAVTLGDSGDTFTIPSGATLAIAGSVTGFTSAGIDDNATSVAITINSSEQVGIGTTSFDQDAKLTIAGSGSGGSNPSSINANTVATFRRTGGTSHVANISVLSGTTGASILNLGDRDDEDIGSITYNHSDNSMAFTTNTSEKMRTTSAGDLLVGTTSTNPGIGNTNTGFSVTNGGGQVGNIAISQNGNYSANFNRNTSDGTIVQFSKSGTVFSTIGVNGGNNPFFSGSATNHGGVMFSDAGASQPTMLPMSGGTTLADNSLNLGTSSYKYKDLYLGGNLYVGSQIRTNSSASTLSIQGGSTYPGAKIQMAGGQAGSNPGTFIFLTDDGNVTNPSERARIDADGNFFVATTTEASDDVGHALLASGAAYHTTDGTYAGLFNRKSSNGEVVQIRKDNTVVGKIGIETGGLTVDGEANHSGIMFSASSFLPRKNYSSADGTVDLGTTDGRWKDLYLGGGAFIGGTGAANKLNDYEEGTWSPALTTDGGGGNSGVTFGARYGSYTKIGNQVTVHVYVDLDAVVAFGTGNAIISTLPFTSTSSNSQYRSGVSIGYTLNWDEAPVAGTITTNSTYIYLRKHSSTDAQSNYNDIVVVGDMNANSAIILTATYETDA